MIWVLRRVGFVRPVRKSFLVLLGSAFSIWFLAASKMSPYFTPLGHAVSQARQPRQESISCLMSFQSRMLSSADLTR